MISYRYSCCYFSGSKNLYKLTLQITSWTAEDKKFFLYTILIISILWVLSFFLSLFFLSFIHFCSFSSFFFPFLFFSLLFSFCVFFSLHFLVLCFLRVNLKTFVFYFPTVYFLSTLSNIIIQNIHSLYIYFSFSPSAPMSCKHFLHSARNILYLLVLFHLFCSHDSSEYCISKNTWTFSNEVDRLQLDKWVSFRLHPALLASI